METMMFTTLTKDEILVVDGGKCTFKGGVFKVQ